MIPIWKLRFNHDTTSTCHVEPLASNWIITTRDGQIAIKQSHLILCGRVPPKPAIDGRFREKIGENSWFNMASYTCCLGYWWDMKRVMSKIMQLACIACQLHTTLKNCYQFCYQWVVLASKLWWFLTTRGGFLYMLPPSTRAHHGARLVIQLSLEQNMEKLGEGSLSKCWWSIILQQKN